MNQRSRPHLRTASTVPAILHNMAHILGNSLYKSPLKVALIPLYQMSSFAHAAEIVERMNMTVHPVLCFHVIAGFRIDITAAREHRYKQIGRTLCASSQVNTGTVSPAQSTWIASPGLC